MTNTTTTGPAIAGDLVTFSDDTRRFVERLMEHAQHLEYISESDSDVLPIAFRAPRALDVEAGPAALTVAEIAAALEPLRERRPMAWEEWTTPLAERELEVRPIGPLLDDLVRPDWPSEDGAPERRWHALRLAFEAKSGFRGATALLRLGSESLGDDGVMGTVDIFLLRHTAPDELAGLWLVSIET
jgi:hypothetical protein